MNQMSQGWNTKDGDWIRYYCSKCNDIFMEYVDTGELQMEFKNDNKE